MVRRRRVSEQQKFHDGSGPKLLPRKQEKLLNEVSEDGTSKDRKQNTASTHP